MTDTTPIDTAHAAMTAAPGDDAARLRFYERLADSELFLLLKADEQQPDIFETSSGPFVLAFDREDRLSGFVGQPAPYAALSGRAIAAMLDGQGVGLGLNLDVAPSAILIPADAIAWLCATLAERPAEVTANIAELRAPVGLPEILLTALDTKLATAAGLADQACLVAVTYRDGGQGHLLAFIGAPETARSALAGAVGEALTFSGLEAGVLDVGFFAPEDPVSARLAAVGLRFDLPQPPDPPDPGRPAAPGMDPDKPPILR